MNQSDLSQFTGTEGYHRWGLFRNHYLTDGAKYVADQAGAYWLFDAIASHHSTAMRDERLKFIQIWKLKTNLNKHTADLECWADTGKGEKPKITQKIEYTDFPLEEITFYVQPASETVMVIMLPSEY